MRKQVFANNDFYSAQNSHTSVNSTSKPISGEIHSATETSGVQMRDAEVEDEGQAGLDEDDDEAEAAVRGPLPLSWSRSSS